MSEKKPADKTDAHRAILHRVIFPLIEFELFQAAAEYGPYASAHEGFAVILEELDELKAWVWRKEEERDYGQMLEEAIQVAATASRFVLDVCCNDAIDSFVVQPFSETGPAKP